MEVKVEIKPYYGYIDVFKLSHWLQQLEVYFSIHNILRKYLAGLHNHLEK